MEYLFVPLMPYGKERRKFIKDWFNEHPDGEYYVNCKYRPQVKDDPDLKKLIRIGFLKQKRIHFSLHKNGGWKKTGSARTYLVKA